MTLHGFLVFVHVLLLVYWLGTDLGVFYSARYVLRPDLPVETRGTIARILLALDLSPRVCLVLMLPVGLSLVDGVGPFRGGGLAFVWVFSSLWLALVIAVYRGEGAPWHGTLRRVDLSVRVALIVALAGTAAASLTTGRPFGADWVSWKVVAYTVAIASGVAIRFVLRPFGPALQRLLAEGSSPEVEAALARSLRGTYPFVLTIWAMLVVAAFLGVTKP